MLKGLGDRSLLGVQPSVLGRNPIQAGGQPFGPLPASHQSVGHQGGDQSEDRTSAGNDPGEALGQGATKGPLRGHDQSEGAVPERDDRRGLPPR